MAKGLHYFRDWPTSAARAHNVEGLLKGGFFHLLSINQHKATLESWPMVFKMTIELKLLRNANYFEYKLAIKNQANTLKGWTGSLWVPKLSHNALEMKRDSDIQLSFMYWR